jgi:hypothetical protein
MHPLRVIAVHHKISICGPSRIVIGDRNRKRRAQPWYGSSVRRKASRSDSGKAVISTIGTRRPRAIFQKGDSETLSRQKACHRVMVAASTSNNL